MGRTWWGPGGDGAGGRAGLSACACPSGSGEQKKKKLRPAFLSDARRASTLTPPRPVRSFFFLGRPAHPPPAKTPPAARVGSPRSTRPAMPPPPPPACRGRVAAVCASPRPRKKKGAAPAGSPPTVSRAALAHTRPAPHPSLPGLSQHRGHARASGSTPCLPTHPVLGIDAHPVGRAPPFFFVFVRRGVRELHTHTKTSTRGPIAPPHPARLHPSARLQTWSCPRATCLTMWAWTPVRVGRERERRRPLAAGRPPPANCALFSLSRSLHAAPRPRPTGAYHAPAACQGAVCLLALTPPGNPSLTIQPTHPRPRVHPPHPPPRRRGVDRLVGRRDGRRRFIDTF